MDNVRIKGFDVGVSGDPGASLESQNVSFDGVRQPFDMPGHAPSTVSGTRIKNDPKRRDNKRAVQSGWFEPSGPPLPVFCPECKAVFPSANYRFGGAYFNAWDNEEACPECGNEHAKLSEGVFDLTQKTIRILSAPDFTYAMLREAKDVSDHIISGAIDQEEAIQQLGELSPALRALLQKAPGFLYNSAMLIATVICAYFTWAAYEHPHDATPSTVQEQHATESVFWHMSRHLFTDSGVSVVQKQDHRSAATTPTKSEAATHGVTPEVKVKRKPKAREIARKAIRERRKALCGYPPHRKV